MQSQESLKLHSPFLWSQPLIPMLAAYSSGQRCSATHLTGWIRASRTGIHSTSRLIDPAVLRLADGLC